MANPCVSVVVPTYNRAAIVLEALESVMVQTFRDFEIVIVDDGSEDGTKERLSEFIAQQPNTPDEPEIRYIYQANQGQSAARNAGIAAARGRWIAFLDSDDRWMPHHLALQCRVLSDHEECRAAFADAQLVDVEGDIDTTAFRRSGLAVDANSGVVYTPLAVLARPFGGIWLQTLVVDAALARSIGGFDTKLHFAEDHDFLFRLAMFTPFAYIGRATTVITRSIHGSNEIPEMHNWDRLDVRLRNEQQRLEKWLRLDSGYPASIRRIVVENLSSIHSMWSNWYIETGEFGQARRAVSAALTFRITAGLLAKWGLLHIYPSLAKRLLPKSLDMI